MTSKQDDVGEITLAGETITISALTLDQLQEVLPAFDRIVAARDTGERIQAARRIIAAATGKADDALGKMTISLPELLAAVATIAKIAGLEELGKKSPASEPTPPASV